MENFKSLENELYISQYGGIHKEGNYEEIWNRIKNNKEVLREAIKLTKDKLGQRDLVKGMAICEAIIVDYENVDFEVYQELVNLIYSNEQIARIVLDSYSRGGYSNISYSFLLMTLWNHNLKLSEEQKAFAVAEATDKTDQVHGRGDFDIRYWILRNPNWTLDEKQKLIMDFWSDDEVYDETLEQWEWNVANDNDNYKGHSLPPFDKYTLFNEWTYEMLLKYHQNKEITDRLWEEMEFCKQMHLLRPQQWELKWQNENKKQLINPNVMQ